VPGRRLWAIGGLVVAAAVAVQGGRLIIDAGAGGSKDAQPQAAVTATMTVSQPITSVNVQSYGAPVTVTGGPVRHAQVTEATVPSGPGTGVPPVAAQVSDGQLTVGSPACNTWQNCVSFAITVPADVTVTVASENGPVTISGVAGVNVDSGGGDVNVSRIDGPVTVTTGSSRLSLADVTGPVQADTGGGSLSAAGITAATATFTTEGGPLQLTGSIGTLQAYTGGGQAAITLLSAPAAVTVSTDGGPVTLAVPGGPYVVTAEGDGGPQSVGIPTSLAAGRSVTVSTGGGELQIEP
jgi:Putative adhesin